MRKRLKVAGESELTIKQTSLMAFRVFTLKNVTPHLLRAGRITGGNCKLRQCHSRFSLRSIRKGVADSHLVEHRSTTVIVNIRKQNN